MCGIVGCIGKMNVVDVVIQGLKKLEYRGYDSAGIAYFAKTVELIKVEGRVAKLEQAIRPQLNERVAMGHTRWATHGSVCQLNAHPHQSYNQFITIVHNGVIDNYESLKKELEEVGIYSKTETDTEVIANLLTHLYDTSKSHNLVECIHILQKKLKGIYSLLIMTNDDPTKLYAIRYRAPLLIGVGKDFAIAASDALAIADYTKECIYLEDGDLCVLEENKIELYHHEKQVNPSTQTLQFDEVDFTKNEYEHYMMAEMHQQSAVMQLLCKKYCNEDKFLFNEEVIQKIRDSESIHIVACGTSYHAGLVGKCIFEETLGKPTFVHIGSEFSHHFPLVSPCPLFLIISQSGETADLRSSLELIKKHSFPVITITNVYGSTLAREADYYLLLHAGPEVAVASTKAYTAQIALLALLSDAVKKEKNFYYELGKISHIQETLLQQKEIYQSLVKNKIINSSACFYIGRQVDYYVALEAALKLKEISYIHSEGFAGGELKHGTIALIVPKLPIIGLITQPNVAHLLRSNLEEVKARGACIITISLKSLSKTDDDIVIDDVHPLLSPLVTAIVIQMIAYYSAYFKGTDIDKPRNLAKSVTVE